MIWLQKCLLWTCLVTTATAKPTIPSADEGQGLQGSNPYETPQLNATLEFTENVPDDLPTQAASLVSLYDEIQRITQAFLGPDPLQWSHVHDEPYNNGFIKVDDGHFAMTEPAFTLFCNTVEAALKFFPYGWVGGLDQGQWTKLACIAMKPNHDYQFSNEHMFQCMKARNVRPQLLECMQRTDWSKPIEDVQLFNEEIQKELVIQMAQWHGCPAKEVNKEPHAMNLDQDGPTFQAEVTTTTEVLQDDQSRARISRETVPQNKEPQESQLRCSLAASTRNTGQLPNGFQQEVGEDSDPGNVEEIHVTSQVINDRQEHGLLLPDLDMYLPQQIRNLYHDIGPRGHWHDQSLPTTLLQHAYVKMPASLLPGYEVLERGRQPIVIFEIVPQGLDPLLQRMLALSRPLLMYFIPGSELFSTALWSRGPSNHQRVTNCLHLLAPQIELKIRAIGLPQTAPKTCEQLLSSDMLDLEPQKNVTTFLTEDHGYNKALPSEIAQFVQVQGGLQGLVKKAINFIVGMGGFKELERRGIVEHMHLETFVNILLIELEAARMAWNYDSCMHSLLQPEDTVKEVYESQPVEPHPFQEDKNKRANQPHENNGKLNNDEQLTEEEGSVSILADRIQNQRETFGKLNEDEYLAMEAEGQGSMGDLHASWGKTQELFQQTNQQFHGDANVDPPGSNNDERSAHQLETNKEEEEPSHTEHALEKPSETENQGSSKSNIQDSDRRGGNKEEREVTTNAWRSNYETTSSEGFGVETNSGNDEETPTSTRISQVKATQLAITGTETFVSHDPDATSTNEIPYGAEAIEAATEGMPQSESDLTDNPKGTDKGLHPERGIAWDDFERSLPLAV